MNNFFSPNILSNINVMRIIVIAIFLLFIISGVTKGLTGKISGILALVISVILVNFMLPHVTAAIRDRTGFYEFVAGRCATLMDSSMFDKAVGGYASSTGESIRDQAKDLMAQYGLDSSGIDQMGDDQLRRYLADNFGDYFPQLKLSNSEILNGFTQIQQTTFIRQLPVPQFLQNIMLKFNNKEGYRSLGAASFSDYVAGFVANILLNLAAFIVTLVISWVIVRLIIGGLHLFSRMPVIHFADRLGGVLMGLIQALVVTWILFTLVALFSGTTVGKAMLDMIERDALLRLIYESNIFLRMIAGSIQRVI